MIGDWSGIIGLFLVSTFGAAALKLFSDPLQRCLWPHCDFGGVNTYYVISPTPMVMNSTLLTLP